MLKSRILSIVILLILFGAVLSLKEENKKIMSEIKNTTTQIEKLESDNVELRNKIQTLIDIRKVEVESAEVKYKAVCSTSAFKSWMDYLAITSPSSTQYKLQQIATTDSTTGQRMLGQYVMVAMGPQYGPVGTKYKLVFESGQTLLVIIGDIKHEGCTSSNDGSMLEFIVDSKVMLPTLRSSGNYNDVYNGKIIAIVEEA